MRHHEADPIKVIVYFRQNGGIAAKDSPVTTHWAEDKNGIPAPLFGAFNTGHANTLPPEILTH